MRSGAPKRHPFLAAHAVAVRALAAVATLGTVAPSPAFAQEPGDVEANPPAGAGIAGPTDTPTQVPPPSSTPNGPALPPDLAVAAKPADVPPPLNTPYLQYGVAFAAEFVPAPGPMCPVAAECILGNGGGIVVRVGRRSAGPWYLGAAYELTKQDNNKLYRLATLQQVRGELRYYVTTGRDTQPYFAIGGGVAGYGNEGGIDTWGPGAFFAIGVETQISRRTVVGLAVAYRALVFQSWVDSAGATRNAGVAQLLGIDISLEGRDPI